jgi:hypothetical protein
VGLQSDIEQPINGGGAVVEIIEYTDPYCTWCWGSEPVLRKLLYVYGDQIIVNALNPLFVGGFLYLYYCLDLLYCW